MGRTVASVLCLACAIAGAVSEEVPADVTIASPGGSVEAIVSLNGSSQLQYRLNRGGLTVLENSRLGITVDGVDLGSSVVSISASAPVEINTSYPYRGAKSLAADHCNEVTILVSRAGGGDASLAMTWRAYDDSVAYHYRIPGAAARTIGGESSAWRLPAGTTAWTQFDTSSYEGVCTPITFPHWSVVATPMTCELPAGSGVAGGYAAIMEAALYGYSGMTLQPVDDGRTMRAKFTDDASWSVAGGSHTPWRVTLTCATLDGLVNSTLPANLNPPALPLLEDAPWIRPGRALWSWWARRDANWDARYEDQWFYTDAAVSLGFEYVVWDEGWAYWEDQGHDFDALLAYARDKNIGVWLWVRWNALETPAQRADFFGWIDSRNAALQAKVIVGVKIDFMNSESKSRIEWYEATLADAADHELMVNFHGANKPTGGSRTFPNEMTREGIRGLEYHIWDDYLPPSHNAALPFTRLLGGHADYTPVTFWGLKLGATSFAHQLAMAFILVSPVTHWADDPVRYLTSPARDVIEAAPTTWDQTIVLEGSRIGDLAAFARRKGGTWFVAVVNGSTSAGRDVPINLSFLSPTPHAAVLLADLTSAPGGFDRSERLVDYQDTLTPWLRPGGGFVAMFTPSGVPADFDGDEDVDQSDFGHLQVCLSGSFVEQNDPDCQDAKLDDDEDVDGSDVGILVDCMSGAGIPGDHYCVDRS